jgi:hypothetical protein
VSDCEQFEPTLLAYISGDVDESGLGPILSHCRHCDECRRQLELHRDLLDLAARAPEPDQADFDALQKRVLHRIALPGRAALQPAPAESQQGSTTTLAPTLRWLQRPGLMTRLAVAAAAATVLFTAGLFAGRDLPARAPAGADDSSRLIEAIRADAASNRDLTDIEDSRFTYSNVSIRRLDAGQVALDFDVTTHVQVAQSLQSDLARDVLVHSLLTPSSVGSRLKAMSYAVGDTEPRVREALIFAMRRDDSLAVRLKALTILSDHLQEPDVAGAVLSTVRGDESVQMRLLALDYLAAHRFDREQIREVIQEEARPGNEALLVRLAEFEKEL